jgi:hypothetical protein
MLAATAPNRVKDISNQRFGRLVVVSYSGIDKSGNASWKCLCDCGNTHTVVGYSLRRGDTISCGCYAKEITSRRVIKKYGLLTGQDAANDMIDRYKREAKR